MPRPVLIRELQPTRKPQRVAAAWHHYARYDNARRLTQVANELGATVISSHTYTLDAVGNRTQLAETLAQPGGAPTSATLS